MIWWLACTAPEEPLDSAAELPVDSVADSPADSVDSGDSLPQDSEPAPLPVIARSPSVELDMDGLRIWNGLAVHEGELLFTSMNEGGLSLWRMDEELDHGEPTLLVPRELPDGGTLTDHAMAVHEGSLLLAFSDEFATEIWLASTELESTTTSAPKLLSRGELDTNDMMLAPGPEGPWLAWGDLHTRELRRLNAQAQIIESFQVAMPEPTSSLGAAWVLDEELLTVSGNFNNHALQRSWLPLDQGEVRIEELYAPDDEGTWTWFSTGLVQHEPSGAWILAYTHMVKGELADDHASVYLAVFDPDWQLVETWQATTGEGWTRPHLAILGEHLVLAYDKPGDVRLASFRIE